MESITRDELKKILASKKSEHVLIDVREPIEIKEHGAIQKSINIPLVELERFLDDLNVMTEKDFKTKYKYNISKHNKLIFYCRAGKRSTYATDMASSKGFIAYNYEGSVLDWSQIDKKVKAY